MRLLVVGSKSYDDDADEITPSSTKESMTICYYRHTIMDDNLILLEPRPNM